MLLTQEPTFVIFMVVNTRINHRKYQFQYMYFTSSNNTLLETITMQRRKTSHIKKKQDPSSNINKDLYNTMHLIDKETKKYMKSTHHIPHTKDD